MATPSSFGGLELWLKGDAGVFQDDAASTPATTVGDPVAVWQDQSGNGRHLTQTVSGNRPTVATGLNSIPSVGFVAASLATAQWLTIPNFLTSFTEGEIFFVIKATNDPAASNNRGGVWSFGSEGNDDTWPWSDGRIYQGWGSTIRQTDVNPTPSLTSFRLGNIRSRYAEWQLRLNEALIASAIGNTVGWTTAPRLGLTRSGQIGFDGEIVELFMYSQVRTGIERQDLIAYLHTRYNIFTPGGHRVTQVVPEVINEPINPNYRATQVVPESFIQNAPGWRVTGHYGEVALQNHPPYQATQVVIELIRPYVKPAPGFVYIL